MKCLFEKTARLILNDPLCVRCLEAIKELNPAFYIGGGIIRNLVWDHLHGYKVRTPLNDVDVVWFDVNRVQPYYDEYFQDKLVAIEPTVNWEVINQARAHRFLNRNPYRNMGHAITTWVDKATAVACRLDKTGLMIITGYGLESLWALELECAIKERNIFEARIRDKRWLETWPKLRVIQ